MTKEEMQNIIVSLGKGESMKVEIPAGKDVSNFRLHIFRAGKYGVEIKMVKLYGDTFYIEKLNEGDLEAYKKSISTNRGNHKMKRINAAERKRNGKWCV